MARPFTIYVMQAAHTDIGYTHPPEQIALMYLEHYDRVLELCRRSADAPEEQRFKWICETAWQVQHYLTARPEREAEFLAYVRRGQIEITASYLHFVDMIDADAYRRSLAWIFAYCQHNALPLRSAVHADINGWPWALADILAEYHIPYFCSQVHIDSATDPLGKRGSVHYFWLLEQGMHIRPDAPIRVPQAFWWRGPGGGQVLHWLGEHYLQGNVLGLSSAKSFNADKSRYFTETDQATVDELYTIAQREVPRYLVRLQEAGYPYDRLLLSTGGFFVDNSPPDGRWCEVIARWNSEHDDIHLRTTTLSEWFEVLSEMTHGDLPTYQVAWPDHWAHGLGSTTARIAQERRIQRRRADALTLVDMASSPTATAYLAKALEEERVALEHTFDAWSTTAHPHSSTNDFAQASKELNFHRAELYLDEAIGSVLRSLLPASHESPSLHAGRARPQDGLRTVHFAADDLHLDPSTQALSADDGQTYPFQRDSEHLARFVATLPLTQENIAHFGLVTQPAAVHTVRSSQTELKTEAWQLQVDPVSGGLLHLHERATGREWVDPAQQYAFGQLVHEVVVHPLGRAAVGNAARLIALGVAQDIRRKSFADVPIFARTTLQIDDVPRYVACPVFDAIELHGSAERIGRVQITWRCYHALPLVELVLDWDKVWNNLPEAAYVVFPFALQQGQLALETGGGFFQPGSHETGGQLPGTCSSYYTVQRAARITGEHNAKLFWLPVDAPLLMTNELNYNRWETEPWTWNGWLASMPVNHYWHTNFPTSQRGYLRLRYRLFSPAFLDLNADEETLIQSALPSEALGWR